MITPLRKQPRYVKINIALVGRQKIPVYAGKAVRDALLEISSDMTLYRGVRLAQVLGAVYTQGRKDGARLVFEQVDGLKAGISHRNPGQPKKRKLEAKKRNR